MAKGKNKISKVMKEFRKGELRSSSGSKIKNREQAIAIALNEARRAGSNIPKRRKK